MIKMTTILFVSFFSYNSFAQNCNQPTSLEDLIRCGLSTDLSRSLASPGVSYCDIHDCQTGELLSDVRARTGRALPGLTAPFSANGADCTNFIRNDGSYGPWGEVVRQAVSNPNINARFVNANIPHIREACSDWANMNAEQRTHFWVWTFAAIAWDEATCRGNARNGNATNGVAVGLLQLDERRADRNWRGPNCRVPNVSAPNENLRCGVDIMAELLRGQQGVYQGSGAIFRANSRNTSYWQKLRTSGGGSVGARIRTYPLCRNSP